MSERGGALAERPLREVWTVSRLNLEARALLESAFGMVWVEGELSNLARPRSGHIYFTLKDADCQVRCAMFRGQMRGLGFAPDNGQQVLLRARVGLYAERGDYQLVVDYMEEAGAGALRRAFDALKTRLAAEGLFDSDRKRALPGLPGCIGVLSSPTGAALHDVLTTLARRFPAIPVIVYPIPVQGASAAPAIERMLAVAAERAECDVLILARGGGSLEDLWPFNEERTARAIAACPIPLVTGVGHEVDFTIADFAADRRAPTPTAAAELVTPERGALRDRVGALRARAERQLRHLLQDRQRHLQATRRRLRHPSARLQELAQRCDRLSLRLAQAVHNLLTRAGGQHAGWRGRLQAHHPQARLQVLSAQHAQLQRRLHAALAARLGGARAAHAAARRALHGVGPQATLDRGYAILSGADGTVLRDAAAASPGALLEARLARGRLGLRVERVDSPGAGGPSADAPPTRQGDAP